MLHNYIKITLRTLQRQKGYVMINVIGLATGVMACLLILLLLSVLYQINGLIKNTI